MNNTEKWELLEANSLVISNEEYHSSDRLSSSSVKLIGKSIADFESPREYKESFTLGTAVHTAVLEPEKFDSTVKVKPKFSGTGSVAKKKEWEDENKECLLITETDLKKVGMIKKNLFESELTSEILHANSLIERTFYWQDSDSKLNLQCRPDLINIYNDKLVVWDLKTTSKRLEDPKKFLWDSKEFGYHISAAFYLDGITRATGVECYDFYLITAETVPPYLNRVFRISDYSLQEGRDFYKKALNKYTEYQKAKIFGTPEEIGSLRGYGDEIQEMII